MISSARPLLRLASCAACERTTGRKEVAIIKSWLNPASEKLSPYQKQINHGISSVSHYVL